MSDTKSATKEPPISEEPSEQFGEILDHPGDGDGKLFEQLDPNVVIEPISAAEARRVLWKIDLIILPLISATVILSAVDKVIISNAAIYGMTEDTHLTNGMFSWVESIFYFGYLMFEYPSAILIQRLPVAKLLAGTVFTWAVLMCCTAATHSFAGLVTVRFIMGAAEAAAYPVCSILTVMWYTKTEQPVRVAFWYNQFSSIFSGIVSYGIGHTNTALAPWRLLFIVLGAFSALWAALLWAFLPDSPMRRWYMSDREKYIAIERIRENNTGIEDRKIKWYQLKECLLDTKTWLWLYSLTFSALVVSGLGYTRLNTTLIGIPTGVLATAWQLILSVPSSKFKNRRCLIIASANLIPITSAALMWRLPSDNRHGRLAAYYVFYTYWGPYVMSTTLSMANTSGHTKKVTMNAIFFLAYCVGNIIGPQVLRGSDAPNYPKGYIGLLACFLVASAAICSYALVCKWENTQRDKAQAGVPSLAELTDPFSDATDKEKASFRYTY